MKKAILWILTAACVLGLTACGSGGFMTLDEVKALVAGQTYTEEALLENLAGRGREEVLRRWGDPDSMLSGLWGDIWKLDNPSGGMIILYYDSGGAVEHVRVLENLND